jgi:hypothetical protein
LLRQSQKFADVFQREPEFLGAANEQQSRDLHLTVTAVAGRQSRFRWQQAALLVIPDRVDADASAPGEAL